MAKRPSGPAATEPEETADDSAEPEGEEAGDSEEAIAALLTVPLEAPAREHGARAPYDPDLVRRAREGDMAAFEALYRAWHRRIYNFIYQMVSHESDATDLTQDVFVKLYESLPTLRAEEAFTAFLYRMTINLCRDHYRRHRRVGVDSLDQPRPGEEDDGPAFEIPDTSGDPHRAMETDELQERVQAALATLSEDHRTVILLHHFQDMELVDIAAIMGCAEGTVKSRLARARDELKRKLRGYLGL